MTGQPHKASGWPPALLRDVASALHEAPPLVDALSANRLPASPGAYLLLVHLHHALPLHGRLAHVMLPAGYYLYTGSARGPGGLRARLRRHLQHEKKIRWHVDQLTTRADMLAALPFPHAQHAHWSECTLLNTLREHASFEIPLPGFGSSDCTTCPAHLLRWTGPR